MLLVLKNYNQLKTTHFSFFDDSIIHFHNYFIFLEFEKFRMPTIHSHRQLKGYSLIEVLQFT